MPDDVLELCMKIGLQSLANLNPGLGSPKADICIPQLSILMAGCIHVPDKFIQGLQSLEKFEIVLNQVLSHKEDFKTFPYTSKVGRILTQALIFLLEQLDPSSKGTSSRGR